MAPRITLAGTRRPSAACACGGGCPRCAAPPAPSLAPEPLLQRQEEPDTPTQAPPRPAASATQACTPTHSFPVGLGRVDITFPLSSSGPLSEDDRTSLNGSEAQRSHLRAGFRVDGFADSTEPAERQEALSCERAQVVGEDLQRRGVPVSDIALFSHGGSDRFDPASNRRAAVFVDVPEASGIPRAEQRQEAVNQLGIAGGLCTVAGTPELRHNTDGRLVLDVGGEGCIAGANNVNPSAVRTCGPPEIVGTPIPDHVCGIGESVPIGDDSVDLLSVESIPLGAASYREFARVIRPDGTICVRTPEASAFRGLQRAIAQSGHSFTPSRSGNQITIRLGGDSNNGMACPPECLCRGTPP